MSTLAIMPTSLTAGTSVSKTVTVTDYVPDDGWSITYRFGSSPDPVSVDGVDDDDGGWTVELTAAQTLVMFSGQMRFDAIVFDGTESILVDAGIIAVTASPLLVSKWSAVLTAVEAAITSWGATDQRQISIEGMDITFRSIGELFKLRAFCVRMIGRETGNGMPTIIRSKFTL